MAFALVVSEEDITEALGVCDECIEAGESMSPELTYEEGVHAAIGWLVGLTDAHPFDDADSDDDIEDTEEDDSSL